MAVALIAGTISLGSAAFAFARWCAPTAASGAATTPAVLPAEVPAAAAEPPAGSFYATWSAHAGEPLVESLVYLLMTQYAEAVIQQVPPPADFPAMATVEASLRDAIVPAWKRDDWLAFLEYHAALRSSHTGDLEAMQAAARRLTDFAARHPEVAQSAVERGIALADLQRALGDSGAALRELERIEPTAGPKLEDQGLRSYLLCVRGEALRETGRLDEAARTLREAATAALAGGTPEDAEQALLSQQSLALTVGQHEAAHAWLEERLQAIGDADPRLRSVLLVFRGHAESGMAGADPAGLRRALATLDAARGSCVGQLRIRADLKRLDLALRAGDLTAAAAVIADCRSSLGAAHLATPPSRDARELIAYTTLWLLRRGADTAELQQWRSRLRAAMAALAQEWRAQPRSLGGAGFLQQLQRRELVAASIELELQLAEREGRTDGPELALQQLLDLQLCTSLARAREVAPCTVRDVQQQLLAPGGAALVFLPTRDTLYVCLAAAGQAVRWVRLPGDPIGDPDLHEFLACLGSSPLATGSPRDKVNAELDRLGRSVRARLIPDEFLDTLRGCTGLTVVGIDQCRGLPIETLVLDDGQLLGEVAAITHTASLPLAVATARTATPVPRAEAKMLLWGCTAPETTVENGGRLAGFALPETGVANLPDLYPDPLRVVDAEATAARFRSTRLADHDIVHLILHRVRRADRGAESGLVMHDEVVWRSDALGPCKGLVVLSACGAGDGPMRAGEGEAYHSFVGAFLWNGASTVIASRNDLLVLDHLQTMAHCHAHIAAGDTSARAMQRARQRMAPGSDLVARMQRAMTQVFGAGTVPLLKR